MEELDGLLQGRRCGVMGIWEEEGMDIVLVGDRSWVLICGMWYVGFLCRIPRGFGYYYAMYIVETDQRS